MQFSGVQDWYVPKDGAGDDYVTTKPVPWHIGYPNSGLCLVVPEGYVFQVSTPRLFRWFANPQDPRLHRAACLHDYALDLGFDRVSAAALFNSAMKEDGLPAWKRLVLSVSVIVYKFR